MGRAILTDLAIRRLRPPDRGRLEVWDAALPGFGVRITETGHRSFVLLTRLRGRAIRVTLGRWPGTSLADARDRARETIQRLARGEDPRRRHAGADAFEVVAAAFVERHAKARQRTWRETERLLRAYVIPRWRGLRLGDISRADVVALADAIAVKTPIQANRVLAVLKRLFRWALDRGLIESHPAAGLAGPGAERQRDRVLVDDELRALWQAWGVMGYPFGSALQVLLLTACRRGEVERMAWAELNLAERLWTVPAARVKTNLPQVVPLSPLAVEVLAAVPRLAGCPFVFSTRDNRPIRDWSAAAAQTVAISGVTGWWIHDLRRTVRTHLSRLGVPADIAERVLGHVIPGVRRVYDRYEYLREKRDALERWAAHVAALVAGDGAA